MKLIVKWKEIETTILSEVTQNWNDKHCMFLSFVDVNFESQKFAFHLE